MNFLGHTSTNAFIAGASAVYLERAGIASPSEAVVYCVAFIFATVMLGPDLDLYHSKVNKNWGLFRVFWWPYSKVFKHRGMSHTPVLSSIVRVLYLASAFSLLLFALSFFMSEKSFASFSKDVIETRLPLNIETLTAYTKNYKNELMAGFLGVVASDLVHLAADYFTSFKKKWFV